MLRKLTSGVSFFLGGYLREVLPVLRMDLHSIMVEFSRRHRYAARVRGYVCVHRVVTQVLPLIA